MASEDRTASRAVTLEEALASKPYRFSFYAAVRALECLNRDKPRVGESAKAVEDPVRLGQAPDLAFAPAELAAYEPGAPRTATPADRVFLRSVRAQRAATHPPYRVCPGSPA